MSQEKESHITYETDNNLPDLTLSCASLSRRSNRFAYDPEREPAALSVIEQLIRTAALTSGPPIALESLLEEYSHYHASADEQPWKNSTKKKPYPVTLIESVIAERRKQEQDWLANDGNKPLHPPLYVSNQLDNGMHPADAWEKRKTYFDMMPSKSIYHLFKYSSIGEYLSRRKGKSSSNEIDTDPRDHVQFVGRIIADEDNVETIADVYDVSDDFVVPRQKVESVHSDNNHSPSLDDYGIKLPAPLLFVQYSKKSLNKRFNPLSGYGISEDSSEYPVIPWTGGTVCFGPARHSHPATPTCKHELIQAFYLWHHDSLTLPVDDGIAPPQRARRVLDPALFQTLRTVNAHTKHKDAVWF